MTPQILASLAAYGVERTIGFASLRPEDQKKVRLPLATRRIDPADIPESAKSARSQNAAPSSSQNGPPSSQPTAPPSSQPSASQGAAPSGDPNRKKRKAAIEAAIVSSRGPGASQVPTPAYPSARRIQGPGNTTWEEGALEDTPEEEPVDELYCTMVSSVVGIQYYKGTEEDFCVMWSFLSRCVRRSRRCWRTGYARTGAA